MDAASQEIDLEQAGPEWRSASSGSSAECGQRKGADGAAGEVEADGWVLCGLIHRGHAPSAGRC